MDYLYSSCSRTLSYRVFEFVRLALNEVITIATVDVTSMRLLLIHILCSLGSELRRIMDASAIIASEVS